MDSNVNISHSNIDKGFSEYLERACEIVNTWPEWKQNLLGIIVQPGSGNSDADDCDPVQDQVPLK